MNKKISAFLQVVGLAGVLVGFGLFISAGYSGPSVGRPFVLSGFFTAIAGLTSLLVGFYGGGK